jgi:hypothetical protein
VPDPNDSTPAAALVSLAETDQEGRYRLENIPPGRIYVTAGRLDQPTYYPGTLDAAAGRIVTITEGSQVSGIDFGIRDESAGRSGAMGFEPTVSIPLNFSIEGGGKLPIISGNNYPVLRFRQGGGLVLEVPFNQSSVQLFSPTAARSGDYQVEIADLPEGYAVKSIRLGSGETAIDLTRNALRVSAAAGSNTVLILNAAIVQTANGTTVISSSTQSDKTLSVVLTRTIRQDSRAKGVRVTGLGTSLRIPIYLYDVPGTVYDDGSFEFEGVPPGRHPLVRFVSPNVSLGVTVVVGDRDVEGVRLTQTPLLPQDLETNATLPAGNHPPGTILPLASIRGRVVQATSGAPIAEGGTVTLSGYRDRKQTYAVVGEGEFTIPDLLPGTYRIELAVSGYRAEAQTVVIDDADAEIIFRGERETR